MGFTGVGVYELRPFQAPDLNANSWGGLLEAGAEIKTHQRAAPSPEYANAKWQLALVAGSGENAEYLIINVLTGYFITATGDNTVVSTPQISPTDPTARWTIKSIPTKGAYETYDVYTITSKVASRGQLSVKGSANVRATEIIAEPKKDADNQKWYFEPQQ
ncbi:hypothetical protein DID88_002702 [Monilinia fructigena]|uniref:Ricin B lectin domain-containing protein n=1 Tax=Monilinia fructigena TaxID=38457 RepID=A0A395IQE3_9HELO|nr:hypothetical protein DID88_002702 [Monilinia fructigena]